MLVRNLSLPTILTHACSLTRPKAERVKAQSSQPAAGGLERRGLSRSLSEPAMLQVSVPRTVLSAKYTVGKYSTVRSAVLSAWLRVPALLTDWQ